MKVHPSQLVEGCVLLEDVNGKSGRPIMVEGTIITNEHITVLQKFLIDSVEISSKLSDGRPFSPVEEKEKKSSKKEIDIKINNELVERSFPVHYLEAVKDYKNFFEQWKNGVPIDISKVRQSIIPLLERINELDMEIFLLYQYSTAHDYMYHHNVSVSLLAAFLGQELGYTKGEWIQIGLAGYLCDAGMTRIDQKILTKPELLTEREFQEVKKHPTFSYRMVENLTGLTKAAKIAILQHHERFDRSGYPLGLPESKINSFARILAVSDTYHAMTNERIYKKKQPVFSAIRELIYGQYTTFDANVVKTLVNSIAKRILRKTAHLSNGKTGEIVHFKTENPIQLFVQLHETGEIITLDSKSDVFVDEIILD